MKFKFEKIDPDFISRRVIAEEARAGRFVTEVLLTPPEWAEFQVAFYSNARYYMPPIDAAREIRLLVRRPMKEPMYSSTAIAYDISCSPVVVRPDYK